MTYSLQELEALCAGASPGPWTRGEENETRVDVWSGGEVKRMIGMLHLPYPARMNPPGSTDADLVFAARTAIPELIAEIRRLDPAYHAAPPSDAVARATDLMREANEKRAKLEKALKDAELGDLRELNAMGLEAVLDDDGNVKIRQKPRKGAML